MIFTFAPERTVRAGFVQAAIDVVRGGGGYIDFVELVCPVEELKSRMANASRLQHQKLASVELFEQLHADGVFDSSHMPDPRLTLDTSGMIPSDSAKEIVRVLELQRPNGD